jgi:hypothetical protein
VVYGYSPTDRPTLPTYVALVIAVLALPIMPEASRKTITFLLEEFTPLSRDRVPRYADMLRRSQPRSLATLTRVAQRHDCSLVTKHR